jgi:endonuclease YncB( thermonuclease family)
MIKVEETVILGREFTDGTLLNAELIKQGYGFAYTKYPFKYMEEFRQYESKARENGRGLWKR